MPELFIKIIALGAGATLVLDLWTLFLKRALGIAGLDYALLGRWAGHIPRGRLRHASIAAAHPIRGERILGWGLHYAIGVAFAAILIAVAGTGWLDAPMILPAVTIGIAGLVAPLFVMQPALGLGIAAARTSRPWRARLKSLVTHLWFGFGLYVSGLVIATLAPA